jgi:kumamolisin
MFNGTPTLNGDSAAETQLDGEFAGMMAPGAMIHIFASAENSDAGEEAMFTAILDDNRAKIANYSWGDCEAHVAAAHKTAMDKIFDRAVAQGVNILVASGDSGADGCRDNSKIADWPAAHPDVVAVGGTSLQLTADNHIQAETGWSGSGGGISLFYPVPSYQTTILSAPYIMRSYPDVAFNADNTISGEAIWTHYGSFRAHWLTIGGTSMAAPQMSGIFALVNEARVAGGKAELGFIDPLIYGASGAQMATMFHDVTKGQNGYAAGKGWDAVTGLGTPAADGLLSYLMSL